mgnify:CR=1 FL=1|tara:strand:+ start:1658 stop:2530 length:873 start_codon:yes stop_codon:yes gene_type:complete
MNSILVTGFFRTGSTLIFSALRKCEELQVFYEPYHPDIIDYVRSCQNGLQNADRERLGHTVDGDYFEEYRKVDINEMDEVFNKKKRTIHHPVLNEFSVKSDLYNYVTYLHEHARKSNKIPVLQANRLNFCLSWFKANFKSNYNILITRNSRDIFFSLKKLASKDGISLWAETEIIDYWNVLSIFNSLKARYSFIKEIQRGYYYKLCFIIEWINRIESNKADLVIPYEYLDRDRVQKSLYKSLNIFSNEAHTVGDFILNNYSYIKNNEEFSRLKDIEDIVSQQIDYIQGNF